MDLFFELIQVALGTRDILSRVPSVKDWNQILLESQRQAVIGLIVEGIDKLPESQLPEQTVLLQWIANAEMIRQRNRLLNKRCIEIQHFFAKAGINSCILKGQGNATMYPNPYVRMPGDIDIWLDGDRKVVNQLVISIEDKAKGGYKDIAFHYKDVEVEAHYFPTYLNNFRKNRVLQQYIEENSDRQFAHRIKFEGQDEICVPTDDFNVVFQMCHLYHHFFCEGIGLRHFVDYLYLLKRFDYSDKQACDSKLKTIELFNRLGMIKFVTGVMWIENTLLGLENQYLLVDADEKTGKIIMKEMLKYGNFNRLGVEGRVVTTSKIFSMLRPFKYIFQFPKESIDRIVFWGWLQLWKLRTAIIGRNW